MHRGHVVPWIGWWHAGRWVGVTVHHVRRHGLAKLSLLHLMKERAAGEMTVGEDEGGGGGGEGEAQH